MTHDHLDLSPLTDEIVIDPAQAGQLWRSNLLLRQTLNALIELPKHGSMLGRAYHALRPEKGAQSQPPRYRIDPVQAGARIDHQISGSELDLLTPVGVLNNQLSAVIFIRGTQKQGGRDVTANPLFSARDVENGIVDMIAIGFPSLIAIKARRQDAGR